MRKMDEPVKKRVDESWKEQAEREKQRLDQSGAGAAPAPQAPLAHEAPPASGAEDMPQARLDLFISGLAMEALIAIGDMPHPTTRKQAQNLPQAKYLIDLLGVLEEKTKGNLIAEEERLLKDALYQLRMRYLAKSGGNVQA